MRKVNLLGPGPRGPRAGLCATRVSRCPGPKRVTFRMVAKSLVLSFGQIKKNWREMSLMGLAKVSGTKSDSARCADECAENTGQWECEGIRTVAAFGRCAAV